MALVMAANASPLLCIKPEGLDWWYRHCDEHSPLTKQRLFHLKFICGEPYPFHPLHDHFLAILPILKQKELR